MAAEVEALMEEMAKLKMKENQTTGFLHTFVHLTHFVKHTTILAEMEIEVEALKEEMAKIKMRDNQTAGLFHTSIDLNTFE